MDKKRSETFDEVAQLYDLARPSYPAALVEDVIALAGLSSSATILEIGSGTGKATILFAKKGYAIHCLEPGRNLAAVAAKNLRTYPQIVIETVSFEDWQLQEAAFDLVMCAQAFHWIPAEVGYPKAAIALKDSGSVALFWNMTPDSDGALFQQLDEAYRTYAPTIAQRKPFSVQVQEREHEILQSGYFKNIVVKRYPWFVRYEVQQYIDLLNTHSDHRMLPEANKQDLFRAIAEVLSAHGGFIIQPYVAVLYLAQKA